MTTKANMYKNIIIPSTTIIRLSICKNIPKGVDVNCSTVQVKLPESPEMVMKIMKHINPIIPKINTLKRVSFCLSLSSIILSLSDFKLLF